LLPIVILPPEHQEEETDAFRLWKENFLTLSMMVYILVGLSLLFQDFSGSM
jgi:hypothetical protein